LSISVVIWSLLRIFQCWNGLYASRQFLGMSLLLSGYSYEGHLFVPFVLLLQFLLLEVIPFLYILDQNFIDKMTEKPSMASLTEPLFEATNVRSRLDISHDCSQLPSSFEL